MMDYSEKWGKDVDEAVRLALEDLGVTENEVMVTVLEEPTKGFLGLGNKLAKVRVEKIQIENEPEDNALSGNLMEQTEKRSVRDFRKKNRPSQGGSGQSDAGSSGGREGRDRREGRDGRDGRDRGRSGYASGGHGGDHNGGHGGGYGDRSGGRRREYHREEIDLSEFDYSNKPQLSKRPDDLVEIENNEAAAFITVIAEKMSVPVEVKAYENDECIYIEVLGDDTEIMIGRRGQTLDSLQYLANLVSNRGREEYKRVIIDIEGYRSRREKVLESLAVKLAAKVRRTGRSVKLEPMNPYERKVIHATLQEIDGITTRSEGEEPYRKVIIEREK
ncbi:MAG: Jag N-terminal domain-containing protein [Clostridiales Family XIII bacterium]|jgi:spoIIIJ-associated protein|nr:Jag N-terminal domain-containing protein [Clostridiales Family XIII bacterium]